MEELETERLLLRKLTMDDLFDYYERLGSDGQVCRFMLWEPHQDIGETLELVEQTLGSYEQGRGYYWIVERKVEPGLIGSVMLTRFDEEEESCSFSCMFARDYWGQGYAAEALQAVFGFAFEHLGIRKITGEHMTGNAAAGGVMRKLGMTHTGSVAAKYTKQGHPVDVECYELVSGEENAITADDYQRQAMRTLNPALSKKDVLINGVMGLCGESGEAIDIVKKYLAQGHPLNREKLMEELGDVAWYLAETAYALDVSLDQVLRLNLEKLRQRYPQGFSQNQSTHRNA